MLKEMSAVDMHLLLMEYLAVHAHVCRVNNAGLWKSILVRLELSPAVCWPINVTVGVCGFPPFIQSAQSHQHQNQERLSNVLRRL